MTSGNFLNCRPIGSRGTVFAAEKRFTIIVHDTRTGTPPPHLLMTKHVRFPRIFTCTRDTPKKAIKIFTENHPAEVKIVWITQNDRETNLTEPGQSLRHLSKRKRRNPLFVWEAFLRGVLFSTKVLFCFDRLIDWLIDWIFFTMKMPLLGPLTSKKSFSQAEKIHFALPEWHFFSLFFMTYSRFKSWKNKCKNGNLGRKRT